MEHYIYIHLQYMNLLFLLFFSFSMHDPFFFLHSRHVPFFSVHFPPFCVCFPSCFPFISRFVPVNYSFLSLNFHFFPHVNIMTCSGSLLFSSFYMSLSFLFPPSSSSFPGTGSEKRQRHPSWGQPRFQ